ncbi:hypothetical protein UFOVP209_32 [uncultured Caudovirales phage]|uniref:Uncharacterized protein n=1 Tax=uncultured Caudovirales phage TaxID=2100421 RepID=A0A6J7WJJ8_9CAUD|nr:hypothetical protein UFOVP209_32 [uncultured Caudovirales phage]
MPDIPQPENLSTYIRDLERRIRLLETAPRLANASVSDDAGVVRTLTGKLPSGDYGFEIHNSSGATVFQVLSSGVSVPRAQMGVVKSSDFVVVTSGTFTPTWRAYSPYIVADAVQITVLVATDPGTTAEIRLTTNGSPISAINAIPANSQVSTDFKWKTAGLVVGTGPAIFYVEVRRTGGAGNVNVYPPDQAHMAASNAIGATATGL